jgi:hypothetical protein
MILETDRLYLREMNESDLPALRRSLGSLRFIPSYAIRTWRPKTSLKETA